MTGAAHAPRARSSPGDRVQLTGPKGRLNTITLAPGKEFHTHRGVLRARHAASACPTAASSQASNGDDYLALRPLLSDFVMSMPRGAAIIYPKDAAQILALADIFPGATVVEAGVGSGALSLWLLRAIGADGPAALVRAPRGVRRGRPRQRRRRYRRRARRPARDLVDRDRRPASTSCRAVAAPASVDRVVLDMLAPWECLDVVADALTPGGVLLCYVATVTQLSRVAEAIRADRAVHRARVERDDGARLARRGPRRAPRPPHGRAHRRSCSPPAGSRPGRCCPRRCAARSKTEYGDEDVELWTPGAVGDREKSDKRLRKVVREARGIVRPRADSK